MIKKLNEYLIPALFNYAGDVLYSINDTDLTNTSFFYDLNIEQEIDDLLQSWTWVFDDDDVIELEFNMSGDYKGYWGNFYVTWERETLECTGMWFSGMYNRTEEDDENSPEQDEHEMFSWINK